VRGGTAGTGEVVWVVLGIINDEIESFDFSFRFCDLLTDMLCLCLLLVLDLLPRSLPSAVHSAVQVPLSWEHVDSPPNSAEVAELFLCGMPCFLG
jgi:hypothetical protein